MLSLIYDDWQSRLDVTIHLTVELVRGSGAAQSPGSTRYNFVIPRYEPPIYHERFG